VHDLIEGKGTEEAMKIYCEKAFIEGDEASQREVD